MEAEEGGGENRMVGGGASLFNQLVGMGSRSPDYRELDCPTREPDSSRGTYTCFLVSHAW